MSTHLLGFDVGGTKCAAVLGAVREEGVTILGRLAFATAQTPQPLAAVLSLEGMARELLARHAVELRDVRCLGISCGGPLDSARGRILSPPNLPGWDDVPIVEWCQNRLGRPARLMNDANACALAEWRWGAGRGCRHLVFLTFGTGMGAGLILNGRLFAGACDLAGEVGHVRLADDGPVGYGKAGSFEGFCSGGGIASAMRQRPRQAGSPEGSPAASMTAEEVFSAAAAGDVAAGEVVQETARRLGRGLAMLIDILNPERIILGSIFVRRRDQLWPEAQAVLRQEALPASFAQCQIVPAALGEALGDYASLAAAMGEEQ